MCEKVIHIFNKKMLPNSKEPLLVKFADYGNKKKTQHFRSRESGGWDKQEVSDNIFDRMFTFYLLLVRLSL